MAKIFLSVFRLLELFRKWVNFLLGENKEKML